MSDAKDPKKADGKDAHAPPPPPKSGGSKVIPIVMGVNSLLLVGVMAFLVLQMKQQQQMFASLAEDSAKVKKTDKAEKAGEKEEEKAEKPEKSERAEPKEEKAEGGEHGGGGEHGEGGAPHAGTTMVRLADFVIHLRNPDADRYARMSFDVEVFGDSDKDRLNASSPRVRDAFIGYLSDRTMEDLRGSEGLTRTKDSLQTLLRQVAPDVRVRALYISDFVVQ